MIRTIVVATMATAVACAAAAGDDPPNRRLKRDGDSLVLDAPIERWDEGVPLGNGMIGALIWGGGNQINISLDRADLWDLRESDIVKRPDWTYATMKRLVAEKNQAEIVRIFDGPYDLPYPTKLPAGRIEIRLPEGESVKQFRLDLKRGEASVEVTSGTFRAFVSAADNWIVIRTPGRISDVRIVRPAGLDKLGYPPARLGSDKTATWMEQPTAGAYSYAVATGSKAEGNGTLIAASIEASATPRWPLVTVRDGVAWILTGSYEGALHEHMVRWDRPWCPSRVCVPDDQIQAHYDLCRYLYHASSKPGVEASGTVPPMPLQGLWTADEGGLPPWKGDYHNDLNTQMTYLAYHEAGLDESGRSWLEFNTRLLPRYQRFAKEFFGVDGAAVPGVMALDGSPMGGWGMYSLSPTNGAWVAQSFSLHWRYTMDERFLRESAYPFCSQIGTALLGLLRPDEKGKLKLPLSSSPEIHDNSLRAWLAPNSNYDLALMRWLFGALAEMAPTAGKAADVEKWKAALAGMDEFDTEGEGGSLTFARGEPYASSHRHFSHLMAIHPLGLLTIEGSQRDRAVIKASVDRVLAKGTDWWCGYSFSWMSCILARCGRADEALDYLEKYQRAFTLRNGFHCNGDQSGSGLSKFTYRPFTLEGNFLSMQAVQEMLLQSWGGIVRVFPAVSAKWADASFEDLRAEGAFRVSAVRKGGRAISVRITADSATTLRLRDPLEGKGRWTGPAMLREGGLLVVPMTNGQLLDGVRD